MNDIYNCYYDDLEEQCGSTAADFYAGLFTAGAKRQLAAINCTLTSNLFYFLFIVNPAGICPQSVVRDLG